MEIMYPKEFIPNVESLCRGGELKTRLKCAAHW